METDTMYLKMDWENDPVELREPFKDHRAEIHVSRLESENKRLRNELNALRATLRNV